MRVGLEIMHTCSSSVLDNSKKSEEHLEEEKFEEEINSKSFAQGKAENTTPVKPTPSIPIGSLYRSVQLEIK